MTSIIKQARVRHTFGDDDTAGWVSPHMPMSRRAQKRTVDLVVRIARSGEGFVLQWIGPDAASSGEHWYIELPYAELGALELFGIADEAWEDIA